MNETNEQEVEQSSKKQGPGEILQAARIEQGITVEDIARQMNLNAKILKSIEDDDYSEIQSTIFIRGYLRTYSRLVGIDDNETIRLFGEFYQVADPAIKSISNTTPEISSNDIRVKWMTYLVIGGLLALLSVWWLNNYNAEALINVATPVEPDESLSQTSNEMSSLMEQNSSEMQAQDSINEDVAQLLDTAEKQSDPEMDEAADTEIAMLDTTEQAVMDETQADTNTVVSEEKTTDTEETNSEETQQIVTAIAPIVVEPQPETKIVVDSNENIEIVRAAQGSDELRLNIVATSWGEIRDASKFKLKQDLMNSGESLLFVGQAPFKVFLGNGYGVEINLNGKSFDFSEHIKSNNTARFELGL